MLEVEVMGREANHVTNRACHMATMHVEEVSLTVLSMGDGIRSLFNDVTNESKARCSCWDGGVNEKGDEEERMMTTIDEERGESSGGEMELL